MDIRVELSKEALSVIDVLESAGFEAWVVGGAVRDAVCAAYAKGTARHSVVPHDIDIACSSRPEQTSQICQQAGFSVHQTGVKHGTVTVVAGSCAFEVTTFRIDGAYSDARHPDSVRYTDSIALDLARRDFTVNAMAWHPQRGLLDPYGGVADIRSELIRCVGDPEKRFSEDALRILRGVRFVSALGFEVEPETWQAMVRCKWRLTFIPEERIRRELDALLLGEYVQDAFMHCASVLFVVLPELTAMKDFDQHSPYHCFDAYDHTAWVIHYMPKDVLGRWAALCHDLGKPASFVMHDGRGHFPQHAIISEKMARSVAFQHQMSAEFTRRLALLVRNHDMHEPLTRKSVLRMLERLQGDVELCRMLIALQRADAMAHAPKHTERAEEADERERLLEQILAEGDAFRIADLALDGNDLAALGIGPGPETGTMLRQLLDDVVEGRVPNDPEALSARVRSM